MTRPKMTVDDGLKLLERSSERAAAQFAFEYKTGVYARQFWKLLVEKLGEPKAKSMMRDVMGDKKPGRPSTPQEYMLSIIIPGHILKNAHEFDEKIARRILEAKQDYVRFKSGGLGVVNGDEFARPNDPIVERKPIVKSSTALKKQVERYRQQMIGDSSLPTVYRPKTYHRG